MNFSNFYLKNTTAEFDIFHVDYEGKTFLSKLETEEEIMDLITYYKENGINISIADANGETLLMHCRTAEQTGALTKAFLSFRKGQTVNVNSKDKFENIALMYAHKYYF